MEPESGIDQYKLDTIQTASPDRLVLMLYQAARVSGIKCRGALAEERWNDATLHGRKLQEILADLADNVNLEHPEGAKMRSLYLFCWRAAIDAQVNRESQALDPALEVLDDLIAGLAEYVKGTEREAASGGNPMALSVNFSG